MYSIAIHFSANIRQCHEKSERFKEKGNTVEYEGKIGRCGLWGWYLSVSQRFWDMEEKVKRQKQEEEFVRLLLTWTRRRGWELIYLICKNVG